jgi:hypothetical protein
MSRSIARARAGRERTSLYQEITHKIITVLEAGRVPWVQPCSFVCASLGIVPTVRPPTILASGSRSCERTIALSFAPPALRQRRQTTYLRSAPSPTNAKVSDQPTNLLVSERRRHALDEAPEMPPQAWPSSVRGRPSSS